jgi:hypothetical protein
MRLAATNLCALFSVVPPRASDEAGQKRPISLIHWDQIFALQTLYRGFLPHNSVTLQCNRWIMIENCFILRVKKV